MSLRLLRLWWLNRVPPPHARLVLLLGLAIRASGVLMLAVTLPVIRSHMAHPWWSGLLALGLAVENAAVAVWWLVRGRPDARVLWVDLPTGVVAIVLNTWLTPGRGSAGWALFVYPNTVLLAFVTGLLCRRASAAVACGTLWAATNVAATWWFRHASTGMVVQLNPPYLINALVGWLGGSMLRKNEERLAAALAAEVRETVELAASAQQWGLAVALHDGVLQTLETLQRGAAIEDSVLRAEVADRATWLRRYIEIGHGEQGDDLGVDLDAVVVAARQRGIVVEVNAARLLAAEDGLGVGVHREVMLEALFQTIAAFGDHSDGVVMVRAIPDRGGVFVTVLSTGDTTPDSTDIADASAQLAAAGGWLRLAPVPCVELWVPGAAGGVVSMGAP